MNISNKKTNMLDIIFEARAEDLANLTKENKNIMDKISKNISKQYENMKNAIRVRYMNDEVYKQGFACERWVNPLLHEKNLCISPKLYKCDDSRKEINVDYGMYEEIITESKDYNEQFF